jgi:hypothetical protein
MKAGLKDAFMVGVVQNYAEITAEIDDSDIFSRDVVINLGIFFGILVLIIVFATM